MEEAKTCMRCSDGQEATHFCVCDGLPTFACSECPEKHKKLAGFHYILPIVARKDVDSDRMKTVTFLIRLENSQKKLLENLNVLTESKVKIERRFQKMREVLAREEAKILAELDLLKSAFEEEARKAITETTEKAHLRGNCEYGCKLADAVWSHCREEQSGPLEVVSCHVDEDVSDLHFSIGINIRALKLDFEETTRRKNR